MCRFIGKERNKKHAVHLFSCVNAPLVRHFISRMNSPRPEIDKRVAERKRMAHLAAEFARTEEALVRNAQEMACKTIAEFMPMIRGFAVQSGNMQSRLELSLSFDLSEGAQTISIHGMVLPPPVKSADRRAL